MSEPLRARDSDAPMPPGAGHVAAHPDDVPLSGLSRRALEQAEAENAVEAVMAREAERARVREAAERRVHAVPRLQLALLLSLACFNAYVWLGNPSWLRFNIPAGPLYQYYEGSWKVAVYLQRERIEEYRRTHGHVPATAQAAGPAVRGVSYTPLAARDYVLAAGSGARRFVYDSKDSMSVMMGRTLVQMGLVTGALR